MYNECGDWHYFKRPYFFSYLVDAAYKGNIFDGYVWPKTNSAISNLKVSKEEKKMHKKQRVNGHVVHKLPKCDGLYYTVEPENSRIAVHVLKYDEGTGEPYYRYYGHTNIWAKQLGRHGYLAEELNLLILKYSDITPVRNYLEYEKLTREDLKALNNTIFKEKKKMGEIRKDRFILCEDEGCYLEITPISNKVIFHFGGETQTIQIPDTYDFQFSVDDKKKSCDLKTVKKKPKLLNMKFTVKARPIFRRKYANTASDDICDSAISFPEPYEGASLHLVIKGGIINTLSSDDELLAYSVGIWIPTRLGYTVDDIPFIERKIREAYNTRKIFPNATNGIEIIRDEVF